MTRSFKVGLLLPGAFAAAAVLRAHEGAGFDISVLVDGTRTMWATVGAGETSSGTDGGDCPNH